MSTTWKLYLHISLAHYTKDAILYRLIDECRFPCLVKLVCSRKKIICKSSWQKQICYCTQWTCQQKLYIFLCFQAAYILKLVKPECFLCFSNRRWTFVSVIFSLDTNAFTGILLKPCMWQNPLLKYILLHLMLHWNDSHYSYGSHQGNVKGKCSCSGERLSLYRPFFF